MAWRNLRSRFVLAALVAAIAPLALLALWLTQGVQRAAAELVLTQLEEARPALIAQVERTWLNRRSDVLFLSQNQVVLDSLPRTTAKEPPEFLRQIFAEVASGVAAVRFSDSADNPVWLLGIPPASNTSMGLLDDPMLVIRDTIRGEMGEVLGYADSWIASAVLFPSDAAAGVAGARIEATDLRSGAWLRRFPPDVERGGWVIVSDTLTEPPLVIRLAAPVGPVQQPFQRASRTGAVALAGVVLLALAATILLATRLTSSLTRVAEAADAVAKGDLDQRLDLDEPGEVGRLATAFNTMTENLRGSLRERTRRSAMDAVGEYASSLSHEVRNGLTSLRIDLQRAEEELGQERRVHALLARSLEKVASLDRTVTGALQIARSGSVDREQIDARIPLRGAAYEVEAAFTEGGAALVLELPDTPVLVHGDAGALQRVLVNLLLNAAQALRPGSAGAKASLQTPAGEALFTITDDGTGIPYALQPHVFEAFQSSKSNGTGLGLSIARQIVLAHGGRIDLESVPQEGTTVRVHLPLCNPELADGLAPAGSNSLAPRLHVSPLLTPPPPPTTAGRTRPSPNPRPT
jgi:signal transduction histidine kinase